MLNQPGIPYFFEKYKSLLNQSLINATKLPKQNISKDAAGKMVSYTA